LPRSWPSCRRGTKLDAARALIEQRKGEHKEVLADARKSGFARARVDGVIRDLDEDIEVSTRRGSTTLPWWSTGWW